MRLIPLTHANHGTPVLIAADLVAGFYFSPGSQCVHVVASGGAVFPAKETLEEVKALLQPGGKIASKTTKE